MNRLGVSTNRLDPSGSPSDLTAPRSINRLASIRLVCNSRAGSKRLRDIHQRLYFVSSITMVGMLYCSRHHKVLLLTERNIQ
jgi:hypothetical protein